MSVNLFNMTRFLNWAESKKTFSRITYTYAKFSNSQNFPCTPSLKVLQTATPPMTWAGGCLPLGQF